MSMPPEDEKGNFIFPDTERCFAHYDYQKSMRCPVCSRRGDCFWATNKRVKEERERAETPVAAPAPCCCGNSGDDEEFPPYPEGDPE